MSEEQIKQNSVENLKPIEELRAEVDALIVADTSKKAFGHFNFRGHIVDSKELTDDDLRTFEIVSGQGQLGELDLPAFRQKQEEAKKSGNWSRKLFWAYMDVMTGIRKGNQVLAESLPDEKLQAFQAEIEELKLAEAREGKTNHLTGVDTKDLTEEDYWMWERYKKGEQDKPITSEELAEYNDKVAGNTSREGFYSFLTNTLTISRKEKALKEWKEKKGIK